MRPATDALPRMKAMAGALVSKMLQLVIPINAFLL